MAQGRIKHYREDKGFGFIQPDAGGEDIFFHISSMRSGAMPQQGVSVNFELGVDRKTGRSRAEKVTLD
jgi:CspA family cold shock protein